MRCGDCKYWKPFETEEGKIKSGQCENPNWHTGFSYIDKADQVYIESDVLEFGEDFGCVHFEKRDHK